MLNNIKWPKEFWVLNLDIRICLEFSALSLGFDLGIASALRASQWQERVSLPALFPLSLPAFFPCHCERSVATSKNKILNPKSEILNNIKWPKSKWPKGFWVLNLDIRICLEFSALSLGFDLGIASASSHTSSNFVVAWFIRHNCPINWATTFLNTPRNDVRGALRAFLPCHCEPFSLVIASPSPPVILTLTLSVTKRKGKNLKMLRTGSAWQSRESQNSKIKMQNDRAKIESSQ